MLQLTYLSFHIIANGNDVVYSGSVEDETFQRYSLVGNMAVRELDTVTVGEGFIRGESCVQGWGMICMQQERASVISTV